MFLIYTYITTSQINGVGLFTKHHVPTGTVVARWDDRVDKLFDSDEFASLPEVTRHYIHKHGTKNGDGQWKLGMDGDQYINHSDKPNLLRKGDELIAQERLPAGTELTCDYRPFRNDI